MLLAIDIGNTNTSLGVFDGKSLVAHWRLTTERARTGDEWGVLARNLFALSNLDFKSIDAIAIASVVPPLNFTINRMAQLYFQITPLFVDHTVSTGLPILYQPAGDVGAPPRRVHRHALLGIPGCHRVRGGIRQRRTTSWGRALLPPPAEAAWLDLVRLALSGRVL